MVTTEAGSAGADTIPLRSPAVAQRRWRRRDWIAALGLFAATAAAIVWQNAHLAVLWDLSYVLDTADRMALGQVPYRDFPLVHAPLTFLVQAAIVRLAGRVYWHHIVYVSVMGGLGTVLAWRITLEELRDRVGAAWAIALLLAAPLTVLGIYCIFPHPSYDCDCAFWILVALWALQRAESGGAGRGFAAGALACVPLFFKQNMGLLFLAAVAGLSLALLIALGIRRADTPPDARGARILPALLAGVSATLVAAALVLHFTAGIGNYLHWTIRVAGQRRLPSFRDMLGVYLDPSLLWTLPSIAAGTVLLRLGSREASSRMGAGEASAALPSGAKVRDPLDAFPAHKPLMRVPRPGRFQAGALRVPDRWLAVAAFALLAAPFFFTLCSLVLSGDADTRGDALLALWPLLMILAAVAALWNLYRRRAALTLRALLPFVVLVAINGTLMSQQLWGSTYAIWPLLVLLLAEIVAALDGVGGSLSRAWPVPGLAILIAATLLVCGGLYTASEERLSYARFPAGPALRSVFPQLAGLATPGPYLPQFDELLRFAAAHIPSGDGLILIPGEDLFYYASGRVPRFPLLLFDPTTDPYSPQEVAALVRSRQIHWLIVKRNLQLTADATPDRAALLAAVEREFKPVARLGGYDIYRR